MWNYFCYRKYKRTELENQSILHQFYLEKYKNGEVNKIIELLNNANKQIRKELRKTNGVYTKKRYAEISRVLKDITKELRLNVDDELDNSDLIDSVLNNERRILKKQGLTELNLPSEEQIRTAVKFKPFAESSNYDTFLEGVQNGLYDTWDNAIRTGYLTGETTDKIIRNVMGTVGKNANLSEVGTIEKLYNSIERNTRTYLQSMASTTRNAMFEDNKSLFSGYKWLATLDRRSCLVCGRLDGEIRDTLEEWQKELPPIHYNCRCTIVPIVKGFEEFEGTRAGAEGYEKGNVTFEEWLAKQSEDVQKDVLGSKFNLYKSGVKINSFVENGKVLTLDEAENKINGKPLDYPIFRRADAETFHKTLVVAKQNTDERLRWRVDVHEMEDYKNDKLTITKRGSTVAVTPDGDIISVCASGDRVKYLMQKAVAMGGNKLDTYDGNFGFNVKQGFEPVSWCKFDEQYAPEGWVKGLDGKENVIFFKYTGKVGDTNLQNFYNKVKASKDYDSAMMKRNNSINKVK